MGVALGLFKFGFAVLQIVRHQLQGFLGAFAIFNVGEGSVPSGNLPMPVSKGNTTHQKPSIFPIRGATEPRLVFERLFGGNRSKPLLGMAYDIFGMDRMLPACA